MLLFKGVLQWEMGSKWASEAIVMLPNSLAVHYHLRALPHASELASPLPWADMVDGVEEIIPCHGWASRNTVSGTLAISKKQ